MTDTSKKDEIFSKESHGVCPLPLFQKLRDQVGEVGRHRNTETPDLITEVSDGKGNMSQFQVVDVELRFKG